MQTSEDREILDAEFALSLLDGDGELLDVLLESFVGTEFDPAHLAALVSSGRGAEAAGYVHAVKGAGRQLGMRRLASAGQRLEDALRGKADASEKEIGALSERFGEEHSLALEAARNLLGK